MTIGGRSEHRLQRRLEDEIGIIVSANTAITNLECGLGRDRNSPLLDQIGGHHTLTKSTSSNTPLHRPVEATKSNTRNDMNPPNSDSRGRDLEDTRGGDGPRASQRRKGSRRRHCFTRKLHKHTFPTKLTQKSHLSIAAQTAKTTQQSSNLERKDVRLSPELNERKGSEEPAKP